MRFIIVYSVDEQPPRTRKMANCVHYHIIVQVSNNNNVMYTLKKGIFFDSCFNSCKKRLYIYTTLKYQSGTITFHHISLQHVFNIIPAFCLSLVWLRTNIVLLGGRIACFIVSNISCRFLCKIQMQYLAIFLLSL
jgi:hypothetical protein